VGNQTNRAKRGTERRNFLTLPDFGDKMDRVEKRMRAIDAHFL
jgi:hypothetical protein